MYVGIDLGTSGVKATLVDDTDRVVASGSAPLDVSRPRPQWSEQDPADWWRATSSAVASLREKTNLGAVRGVGLSGQMHGATLLDKSSTALRPAILWNDNRSTEACAQLEARVEDFRAICGNLAMPGFTAPKLLWVREHEPEIFARVHRVLLPKDFLRLQMTGDCATDLADASGTLWLDVKERDWSETLLDACGLSREAMPKLFEGSEVTGTLRPEIAEAWGMPRVPVAAGGGDQAAGAIGAGVIEPGEASLALGTSGVLFVAGDRFRPFPERAVHAFCHALPDRWHQMSVILSAASCLSWVTRLTGARDEAALLGEIEAVDRPADRLLFLPYLSGERTPHNDARAAGVFYGLRHDTDRAELGRAVLEGVAFALADGQQALVDSGTVIGEVSVIGGGARSPLWGRILASALGRPLATRSGAEVGPALGAARLARMAVTGEAPESACSKPPVSHIAEPDPALSDLYSERLATFRRLYANLQGEWS
ncbi:MAG: xylulokinase [Myxococcota bacterium]|nr:xylulokinase [Myxococcota bacterium]